jgi:hypothetical protein
MNASRAERKHGRLLKNMAFDRLKSVSTYAVMRLVLREDPCKLFVVILRSVIWANERVGLRRDDISSLLDATCLSRLAMVIVKQHGNCYEL